MRRVLPIILFFTFLQISFGQNTNAKTKYQIREAAKILKADAPQLQEEEYLDYLHTFCKFSDDNQFHKVSSLYNKSGFTRQKYRQTYQDLEVVGATYTLHEKDGLIHKSTGHIAPFISINVDPSLDKNSVIQISRQFLVNELLDEQQVSFDLQFDFHDIKLVIIDKSFPEYSGDYQLAYQIFAEANTSHPIHEKIYVNAHNGKIINNFTEVCDHSVPGKVKTRYYGTQDIISDSIAPNTYVLRDTTRGNGIFTLNGPDKDNSLDYKFPDFYDEDNVWDNANDDFDEVAGDAHYCTSSFYDFLSDEFDWSGLDNDGLEFVTVVQASQRFYVNAYWDGKGVFVGNGNCDQYGPLTVLDVIGHEYTHGVIDYSCNLVYKNESGALNESLADIFGKTLEYKYDNENFNWLIGNKFRVEDPEGGFRDMKDPNEVNDPKFYLGEDWQFSSSDNGGVHSNSGVFNYWYYLLVEGAMGTNEIGYDYNVVKIGIDDAMQIVFGCMTGYFTESTNYPEAMRLSLEQTIDLFGENSQQYESVLEAWMVVGLYPGIDDYDLSLAEVTDEYFGCPGDEIYPEVLVINTGSKQQDAGTKLELSYVFDGGFFEAFEDYYLVDDMMPGDSIYYTFTTPVVYEADLGKDINIFLLNVDNIFANNDIKVDLEFSDMEGADVELTNLTFRVDDECNPQELYQYKIEFSNNGCLAISEDDTLTLIITTDLQVLEIPYEIVRSMDPTSSIISYRNFEEELIPGFIDYSAELIFDEDVDDTNNSFEGSFGVKEGIKEGYLEEFNEWGYRDKLNINASTYSTQDSVIEYRNSLMFAITRVGSNVTVDKCDDITDLFDENSKQATITACIDATGMDEPIFGMDIAQLRNGLDSEIPEEFRTIVKVSHDSIDYPLIYNQPNGDVVYHEFPIPIDYIGNFKIEVFTYSRDRDALDPVGLDSLDAVLFDNLELYDKEDKVVEPPVTDYMVAPTLVQDFIQVLSPDIDVEYEFIIFDVLGRKVYQEFIFGDAEIPFNEATPGAYFYLIKEGRGIIQKGKLVKV